MSLDELRHTEILRPSGYLRPDLTGVECNAAERPKSRLKRRQVATAL